jgi:uncharacterized protein YjbJ (UPF0337 family)
MADYKKDSIGEEASAFGQRVKGAAKDAYGDVTDNKSLEREGERENAEGNARQEANDVIGTSAATGTAKASARRSTVSGLFRDRESAEHAYRSMADRGYGQDDVNLVMSDETRKKHFGDHTPDTELGSKALEGAGVGGAIGGATGAVLAAIAAVGTTLAIPGLGLVIAGPIAAALAGAGAGSMTGGLIGALVGAGIPEDRAKVYEEGVKKGGIYMGVNPRTDEDAEYFEREWKTRGEQIYR